MNLRHLEFFVELAHTEHMAKAAENLGITQPSLSYAISSIEKELGVPLFEKDGRNIKLSKYGKIYLRYVKAGLADFSKGNTYISELVDTNSGTVRFGFSSAAREIAPVLVSAFKHENPEQHLNFYFEQDVTSVIIQKLLSEKVDLAIVANPDDLESVNLTHLFDQKLYLAVSINSPLAKQDKISVNDLASYPLITYPHINCLRQNIDTFFERAGIEPNISMVLADTALIMNFVNSDFGVAIVPKSNLINQKEIKFLEIDSKAAINPVYVATKKIISYLLQPNDYLLILKTIIKNKNKTVKALL